MTSSKDAERQSHFVDLVAVHQGALRKVVAVYARTPDDREDLFQEILLQLWRSFDAFRGEAAFATFLYRVALNTALMGRRRARHRPALRTQAAIDAVTAPAPRRDDEEDVERLYAAIRGLGPIDRAIVLLMLEDESHAAIAAVTGLTVGNVGVRLVRARERLRRLLGAPAADTKETRCSTKT